MWPESNEQPAPLRTGLTTGTCATACCIAASEHLFTNRAPRQVTVTLPRGQEVSLTIASCDFVGDAVRASTVKDAGDDPDITHGATIYVVLRRCGRPGIRFGAGEGVGTVTRAGLELGVGEPAINPVPRRMMREHLARQSQRFDYHQGFEVRVGVENGETLARKTMNPRLGILGGLSILGTTGIVRPYSCAAWIASIYQGIDVAGANGLKHIAAATGNASENAIRQHYGLDDMALIEMGDFAGAVLRHLRKVPLSRVSICGGFGKISKLAGGNRDLNSRASSIDFGRLARHAAEAGADRILVNRISAANTSMEAYELGRQSGIDIVGPVCREARGFALSEVSPTTDVEVWAVDRSGRFIGHAGFEA